MKRTKNYAWAFALALAITLPTYGKYIPAKEKKNVLNGITEVASFDKIAENGIWHQSAANYGKYLFMIQDKLSGITLYDLEQKKPLFHLTLPPHEEPNFSGNLLYHCNNSNFGVEFYDKDDVFPLLYISQRQVPDGKRGLVTVFRILPHFNQAQEIDSFAIEQVQAIYLPGMTSENRLGTPNVTIDKAKKEIVAYSRYNNKKSEHNQIGRITRMKLPTLRDANGKIQEAVYLNDEDISDAFNTEWKMTNAQGGFVHGNLLVIGQGFPTKKHTPINIHVIDLKKHKVVGTTNIYAMGFKDEPEGVFLYNGKVMISSVKKNFYVLNFKK